MKSLSARIQFLVLSVVGVGILQAWLLLQLSLSDEFVCNGEFAWPFSFLPYFGNFFIPFLLTAAIAFWAWRDLRGNYTCPRAIFWALIVSAGMSHTLERAISQCVLDYWVINFFHQTIHFNGGDIFLTLGTLALIVHWFALSYKNT